MLTITTPTGIFVDAGEGIWSIQIINNMVHYEMCNQRTPDPVPLPPTHSYLPPIAVKDMSEEQAAEVVEMESYPLEWAYVDYEQRNGCDSWHETALDSLQSLLRYSSLNPATTYFIKFKM